MFDEVRAQVPRMNLDTVFESKEEIASTVKEELAKSMGGFGYQARGAGRAFIVLAPWGVNHRTTQWH